MFKRGFFRILLLGLFVMGMGSFACAGQRAVPVYVANQNPFVQIFGLPKAEPGTITPKGRFDAGFLYFVSNNAIESDAPNGESIVWDGETTQYTLKIRYGLFESLELGVDVPLVEHGGGYLDSVIRNYHKMVGFPNNRQELFEKNQILYQVDENGTTIYSMKEKHSGLGDVRLTAAVPLVGKELRSERHLALRSLLKLPTGNSDYLLGSGGMDLSVGLAYSDYQTLNRWNMVFASHLGMIYMGEGEVLQGKQRNFAGYGGASLDWLVWDFLGLKLQLDMHSAFYHSELKQLGSSMQLLSGGTLYLPSRVSVDFGISEQLVTDATPDVGFYLLIRHLF